MTLVAETGVGQGGRCLMGRARTPDQQGKGPRWHQSHQGLALLKVPVLASAEAGGAGSQLLCYVYNGSEGENGPSGFTTAPRMPGVTGGGHTVANRTRLHRASRDALGVDGTKRDIG